MTVVGEAVSALGAVKQMDDPAWLDKMIVERLVKLGLTEVEAKARLNVIQGYMKGVETSAEQYGSAFGIKITQNEVDLFKQILEANKDIRKNQADQAMALFNQTMGQFNGSYLDGEKMKLGAMMGPYETAGRFAGFVYAVGSIIEAVSPGSGRELVNSSKSMIDEINSNIRAMKIAPPNPEAAITAYNSIRDNVTSADLFKLHERLEESVKAYGDEVDANGASRKLSDLERRSHEAGTNPRSPVSVSPVAPQDAPAGNPYPASGSGAPAGRAAPAAGVGAGGNPYPSIHGQAGMPSPEQIFQGGRPKEEPGLIAATVSAGADLLKKARDLLSGGPSAPSPS